MLTDNLTIVDACGVTSYYIASDPIDGLQAICDKNNKHQIDSYSQPTDNVWNKSKS